MIGDTYCIFFILLRAYVCLEEALGVDIRYVVDAQLVVLIGRLFCNGG